MSRAAFHGFACGAVQGVGFRHHAVQLALSLGAVGWIRNCSDGRVEFHLEGEAMAVEAMLGALRQGPSRARIQALECSPCAPQGLTGFQLRRD